MSYSRSAAVGNADVAPHFGRTCGDAREVAEATGGVVEILVRARHAGEHVDQREREQVRQMTDCCKHVIVLGRTHPVNIGTGRLPWWRCVYTASARFGAGAKDDLARFVKLAKAALRLSFSAGDWVRRDKLVEPRAERNPRFQR